MSQLVLLAIDSLNLPSGRVVVPVVLVVLVQVGGVVLCARQSNPWSPCRCWQRERVLRKRRWRRRREGSGEGGRGAGGWGGGGGGGGGDAERKVALPLVHLQHYLLSIFFQPAATEFTAASPPPTTNPPPPPPPLFESLVS